MIYTMTCGSNLKLVFKNSSNLYTKHRKIEDLQKSCCYGNSLINDKIKDIPECILYRVITQINIGFDHFHTDFTIYN